MKTIYTEPRIEIIEIEIEDAVLANSVNALMLQADDAVEGITW